MVDTSDYDLANIIADELRANKAFDVRDINFEGSSDIVDRVLIASGNSAIHVKAIAKNLVDSLKKQIGVRPLRIDDDISGEWIVIDYNDMMIHILQPQVRDYYDLEEFWEHSKLKCS